MNLLNFSTTILYLLHQKIQVHMQQIRVKTLHLQSNPKIELTAPSLYFNY